MSTYEPDFIERNGAWLLSMFGILTACVGGMMAYMIRSRCTKIRCCGFECDRDVIKMTARDLRDLERERTGGAVPVREIEVEPRLRTSPSAV